ncbi:UDP-2,3-diacylglucosamine diphosphatase [Ramlibacter tataouinensis]|uniref:UDP-2,3-diacylglucosamine hydrolase n=1 Tax=Ramlibacter tataouinensis TaxID=94132 RepID=A0A127JZ08_9BURK|nr:UDP-2,3-diacylglucosamine diphosphatase [Ramlibacter tataouinensis]AMO25191.1 UDP-2,3-diacylglucosamine hydrolase [Ramlibacter tataouinensis]
MTELQAPPRWRSVEFISDLHLQAQELETFDAWRGYMASTAADAVFILGDLFEVWVGDDLAQQPGFAADCAAVLQATVQRVPVFLMHGNRDFLVGHGLLRSCGAVLLQDPTVLSFAGSRWLLTHGDALCLGDTDYLRFREQVRSPQWQREFLARPLEERVAIGRAMRAESEARKDGQYTDVDEDAARAWLDAADAQVMIHGHTHRPAEHELGVGRRRIVLTDWDLRAQPPRQEVLRLGSAGAQRIKLL